MNTALLSVTFRLNRIGRILFTCHTATRRTEVEDEFTGQSRECVVLCCEIELPISPRVASSATPAGKTRRTDSCKEETLGWLEIAAAVVILMFVEDASRSISQSPASADRRPRNVRQAAARDSPAINNLGERSRQGPSKRLCRGPRCLFPLRALSANRADRLLSWRVLLLPYSGEEEFVRSVRPKPRQGMPGKINRIQPYTEMPSVYPSPRFPSWSTGDGIPPRIGAGTFSHAPVAQPETGDRRFGTKTILVVVSTPSSIWTNPWDALDLASTRLHDSTESVTARNFAPHRGRHAGAGSPLTT